MKVFSENKKANFNYNILERIEAGIVLNGQEVKSIRLGRMSLEGSYVILKGEEPFLIGGKVPAYQPKNAPSDYDPERVRKLLLNKQEIMYLIGKTSQRGLTLVPLKVYSNGAKIKLEFGIAQGKKKFDKREDIKKRETNREMARVYGRV